MSPPALDPALLDRRPAERRDAVEAQVATMVKAEREARVRAEAEREARLHSERARADMVKRVARLGHLIAELRRARFGRSSEKLSADQLEMAFEDIEVAIVEAQATAEGAAEPALRADGAPKPHRRLRALPKDPPREERVIEPCQATRQTGPPCCLTQGRYRTPRRRCRPRGPAGTASATGSRWWTRPSAPRSRSG